MWYNLVVFENNHFSIRVMQERGGYGITTRITLIGSEQCGVSIGYGIRIETAQGDVLSFPCISYCREETDELLSRMLCGSLQPVHYTDVVRDYITELYYRRLKQNGLLQK